MIAEIDETRRAGDTLGGVVEVLAYGLPPGLGSHTHGDRRLDARLAAALMGIQAIKGVEMGDGFELARIRGSQAHDEIVNDGGAIRRVSGRSGGTEGGMTTGEVLRVRAAMKPISTVPAGAADRRHRHRRGGGGDQPALGRVRGAGRRRRGRGDGRARAGRGRRWTSSAATRSPRPAATSEAYLARLAERGPVGRTRRRRTRAVMAPKVVLVGLPGAGKTSSGRRLAKILAVPFADSDDLVEAADGRTVRDDLRRVGRGRVPGRRGRRHRRARCADFAGVLVTRRRGAGTPRPPAPRIAASGVPVVRAARPARPPCGARVGDGRTRPLLADDPRARLAELAGERDPLYDALATFTVDTDGTHAGPGGGDHRRPAARRSRSAR